MRRNKALLLVLCVVTVISATAFGTLAYLTDNDAVTNTFTVGKVTLGDPENQEAGLDEAKTNENGKPVNDKNEEVELANAPRVQANVYKLMPGHEYTKDPTVHVKNDSENSYIYVTVANGIAKIEAPSSDDYNTIAEQVVANGWIALKDGENAVMKDGNQVYYKSWTQPAGTTGTTDLIVFGEFQINGEVEGAKPADAADDDTTLYLSDYVNAEIVINAYAVQQDGFADAAAAWKATFGASTQG